MSSQPPGGNSSPDAEQKINNDSDVDDGLPWSPKSMCAKDKVTKYWIAENTKRCSQFCKDQLTVYNHYFQVHNYSSVQKSGDFSPNQNRLLLICLNPSKPNIYGSYSTVRSDHTSLKVSKCSNLSTNVERHVNDHKTTLPKEN